MKYTNATFLIFILFAISCNGQNSEAKEKIIDSFNKLNSEKSVITETINNKGLRVLTKFVAPNSHSINEKDGKIENEIIKFNTDIYFFSNGKWKKLLNDSYFNIPQKPDEFESFPDAIKNEKFLISEKFENADTNVYKYEIDLDLYVNNINQKSNLKLPKISNKKIECKVWINSMELPLKIERITKTLDSNTLIELETITYKYVDNLQIEVPILH